MQRENRGAKEGEIGLARGANAAPFSPLVLQQPVPLTVKFQHVQNLSFYCPVSRAITDGFF